MLKLSEDEKKRLRHGDPELLGKKLAEIDQALVDKLKRTKDPSDVRYWQGASHVVDFFLTLLK